MAAATLWGVSAATLPEFETQVKAYTKLVDSIDKKLGRQPKRADADEVHAHQRALAEAITNARRGARQGDVFVPSARAALLAAIRAGTAGPEGAAARRAILEDNPKTAKGTPPVPLAVNARYPEGAPLSTVPPTLLLRLPPLPEGLDYRFVGKALVLRDSRANLIVDYLPNALP